MGLDRDPNALNRFQRNMANTGLNNMTYALHADFHRPLPLVQVDGMLAANALHFTRDAAKVPLLRSLTSWLRPGGQWIIVEYNVQRGTAAVPHPLPADGWIEALQSIGLQAVRRASRTPSHYLGEMVAISGIKPDSYTASR